jgi:structure-specific endonuclease subunit SLX1
MNEDDGKEFFVYLLESTAGTTYVGATVNLDRRLRQHNNEIKGGAHRTTQGSKRGNTWMRVCYVKNFPDWRSALQFEWKWKNVSRRINAGPMERRMRALVQILASEKSTSSAIPFSEWDTPPMPVFECSETADMFKQCAQRA